jgi:hypothetical protein
MLRESRAKMACQVVKRHYLSAAGVCRINCQSDPDVAVISWLPKNYLYALANAFFGGRPTPYPETTFTLELCTRVFVTLSYGLGGEASEDFDPLPPPGGLPLFLGGKTARNGPSRGR